MGSGNPCPKITRAPGLSVKSTRTGVVGATSLASPRIPLLRSPHRTEGGLRRLRWLGLGFAHRLGRSLHRAAGASAPVALGRREQGARRSDEVNLAAVDAAAQRVDFSLHVAEHTLLDDRKHGFGIRHKHCQTTAGVGALRRACGIGTEERPKESRQLGIISAALSRRSRKRFDDNDRAARFGARQRPFQRSPVQENAARQDERRERLLRHAQAGFIQRRGSEGCLVHEIKVVPGGVEHAGMRGDSRTLRTAAVPPGGTADDIPVCFADRRRSLTLPLGRHG